MDSRTYLETKSVGYQLDGKRQAAAEYRQARQATRQARHDGNNSTALSRPISAMRRAVTLVLVAIGIKA